MLSRTVTCNDDVLRQLVDGLPALNTALVHCVWAESRYTCKIVSNKVSIFRKQYIFTDKSSIFHLRSLIILCLHSNLRVNVTRKAKIFLWKCTTLRKHWIYLKINWVLHLIQRSMADYLLLGVTEMNCGRLHQYKNIKVTTENRTFFHSRITSFGRLKLAFSSRNIIFMLYFACLFKRKKLLH